MEHEEQLRELLRVFLEKNTELNLSALRDEERCWTGNILDSLAGNQILESIYKLTAKSYKLLDIGTGGGFPLLPLAITHPDIQFTGMDSTAKKCKAVDEIAKQLYLSNVSLATGRTEDLGHDSVHREQYDTVTARALSPLPTLIEYAAPFLKVGGTLLAWKSMHIEDELEESKHAQEILSMKHIDSHIYDLGGDWGERQIVMFEKTRETSDKFPREVGAAKKNPL